MKLKNYLYKTRMSLFNFDFVFLCIVCFLAYIVNKWAGLASLLLFTFWTINIITMRVYVYENFIEYKAGVFINTYTKTIPMRNVGTIKYKSSVIGKILNYGDVVLNTYNGVEYLNLKGVKNAKMFCENVKVLMLEE